MRAINHALTGAIIGLVIGEPAIAVPAAVASHFVCDAIPHYDGIPVRPTLQMKMKWLRTKTFKRLLYADALLCFGLVAVLAVDRPVHWLLAAICAFAAASPDFLSVNFFIHAKTKKKWTPNMYMRFVDWIQWFQRPIGWVVEAAWFIGALILLAPLLRF